VPDAVHLRLCERAAACADTADRGARRGAAEAKGWPFPALDPDIMTGVGLRPCSIFGMDQEQENEVAEEARQGLPAAPRADPSPTRMPSGERVCVEGDAVGQRQERNQTVVEEEAQKDEEVATVEEGGKKGAESAATSRELPPPRAPAPPILVYLPLVKNEEVDEELEPLTTAWCDLFEFAYEVPPSPLRLCLCTWFCRRTLTVGGVAARALPTAAAVG